MEQAERALCFATPTFVVVRSTVEPVRYELLDALTGTSKRKMTGSYFLTAFCPSYDDLPRDAEFARSNVTLVSGMEAWEKSVDRSRKDIWINHDFKPFRDDHEATLPFSGESFTVHARNDWTHRHYQGSAQDFPACALGCEAQIAAFA